MRPQAYKYLCYSFAKYFAPSVIMHWNKTSQLDHKNNYVNKYSKIVDQENIILSAFIAMLIK